MSSRPVLSLILCSRNDAYMGNSVWRLQTALNYLARQVEALGRMQDVEVLVTDWGSAVPLHAALRLTPAAAQLVSFVVVPPTLASSVQRDSPFSEVHALNAAARRARGEYIGRIDQDILVGRRFLATFFSMWAGTERLEVPLDSALLFANRRRISYRFAVRIPPFQCVERFVRLFGRWLRVENLYPAHAFYLSFVGIWLAHRSLWEECGGYDERLIYMNEMESDMIARLMKKYRMVNLGALVGTDFYHLEHYHPRRVRCPSNFRKINREIDYGRNPPEALRANGLDWGLARAPLTVAQVVPTQVHEEAADVHGSARFALLVLWVGLQTCFDNVLFAVTRVPGRWWTVFSVRWERRAGEAWRTVSRQPVLRWPGLLRELCRTRKAVETHHKHQIIDTFLPSGARG